jgi:hypothetical protein
LHSTKSWTTTYVIDKSISAKQQISNYKQA